MSDDREPGPDAPPVGGVADRHDTGGDAVPSSRRAVHARRRRSALVGAVRESVIVVGTALVLSLLIKTFLAQAFFIPSQSMENTLVVNDRVLVSLLEPGPLPLERGDVVVFRDPGGWLNSVPAPQRSPVGQTVNDVLTFVGVLPQDAGEHLIKRVIGLPGDRITCDGNGPLFVNGVALEEDYLPPGTAPSLKAFDVTVPAESIWLMGDNRGDSLDSRFHPELNNGALKENYIVGRAVLLFWPLDRFTTLSNHPEAFEKVPDPS